MILRKTIVVTMCSTALVLLPLSSGSLLGIDVTEGAGIAHAKSNNGGGNSNAGGNGNNGASNSGKSNSKGGSSASRSKSKSDKKTKTKGNDRNAAKKGGFLRNLFKKPTKNKTVAKSNSQVKTVKTAKTTKVKVRTAKIASVELADIPVPSIKPEFKDKNFNAKLAGLNSLNRNYKAYMNSSDPRMAIMREFIEANLATEEAAAAAEEAGEVLSAANAELLSISSALVAYDDGFDYETATLDQLKTRIDVLNNVEPGSLSDEDAAKLATEISELTDIIASEQATAVSDAETELLDAEMALTDAESSSGDEALTAALLAAANANRVAEYGEENYVDDEMLNWANEILGVGDAYGVIDQVRESSDVETAEVDEPIEPVDPIVSDEPVVALQ